MIEELPWDALQNGVPEARVAQHTPLAAVNHHHLDAIFQAGVLLAIHLQTKATAGVRWVLQAAGSEGLLPEFPCRPCTAAQRIRPT